MRPLGHPGESEDCRSKAGVEIDETAGGRLAGKVQSEEALPAGSAQTRLGCVTSSNGAVQPIAVPPRAVAAWSLSAAEVALTVYNSRCHEIRAVTIRPGEGKGIMSGSRRPDR